MTAKHIDVCTCTAPFEDFTRDVWCVTGRIFHALGPVPPEACPFVRISFSSASDADLAEGIARLATVLKRYQATNAAQLPIPT